MCDIGAFEAESGPQLPTIIIADSTATEGNETVTATFTVTLSFSSTLPVTVTYETVDGTAVTPDDYTSVSGTLTFPPGETSQTIHVLILGDMVQEETEAFSVNLSNPVNAAFGDSQATGTILNDDYQVFLPILLKP